MKKIALSITALAMVLAVTFTSCKKDDTSAPVISLNGPSVVNINLGDTYIDAGATATDDEDGDITPTVSGIDAINTAVYGEYVITYTAVDDAGNETTATRTVRVCSDSYAGSYNAVETYEDASTGSYNQVVIASSTGPDKLVFNRYGDYDASSITMTINEDGTFVGTEKTFTTVNGGTNYTIRVYNIAGTCAKVGSLYNILTSTYKTDITPSGQAVQTTTTTQVYTRQ